MKDVDPEEHDYLRTSFLDRVAHELRGPAGVIDGAVQELEAALGPGAQEHRVLLDMMRRGVRRIVRTADRLQQTGQCERDSLELTKARCDLTELVKRAVAEAAATEGRKKIRVDVEAPQLHSYVDIDERWMGVAVYEIASNSIRHAREAVRVTLEQEPEAVIVSFIDDNKNGNEFAPMRWKPPREARGLGLALAIVRDVLQAHGGSLTIDRGSNGSDDIQKTRVRIRIPHRPQPSVSPAAPLSG
ncbi:MAG TPA: HAMP domain-containing sensor histidine kinase [Polyangiales bacterium]|nr:HAMP domain-containing sensor histidine kinase [Polyangiales bacterium]